LSKEVAKVLTPLQIAFLDYLATEAKGDLRKAKELAGYSDQTRLSEVVNPLKEEILELAKDMLNYSAVKAVVSLQSVLDTPHQLGAANAVKAATEVLDRIGVIKQADQQIGIPEGTIFILPPKDGKVSMNFESNKIVDVTPNE